MTELSLLCAAGRNKQPAREALLRRLCPQSGKKFTSGKSGRVDADHKAHSNLPETLLSASEGTFFCALFKVDIHSCGVKGLCNGFCVRFGIATCSHHIFQYTVYLYSY